MAMPLVVQYVKNSKNTEDIKKTYKFASLAFQDQG
jgi:hypothetical protein